MACGQVYRAPGNVQVSAIFPSEFFFCHTSTSSGTKINQTTAKGETEKKQQQQQHQQQQQQQKNGNRAVNAGTIGSKSENNVKELQTDLNKIYQWVERKNLELNGEKFQLLIYGKNTNLKENTKYYDPNGNEIVEESCVKDLGIQMTNNAHFYEHIQKTSKSASSLTGWILRTFCSRDQSTMLTLFKSLILSKLDYCSPLINPANSAQLNSMIETVQRAFTRKISGMKEFLLLGQIKENESF